MMRFAKLLLFGLIIGILSYSSHSLSLNNNHGKKNPTTTSTSTSSTSRRQAMAIILGVGTTSPILATTKNNNNFVEVANASCIAGDLNPDCIGSYKEAIPGQRLSHSGSNGASGKYDDIEIRQYTLRPHRDNVILTTPDTLEEAIGMLSDQRLALDDMEQMVKGGRLEEAGVLLLGALPKLTVAGRFVVAATASNAVTSRMMGPLLDQTQAAAATLDKTIAKGIRGHNGVLTAAQLAILKELTTTKSALDDLIKLAKAGQTIM